MRFRFDKHRASKPAKVRSQGKFAWFPKRLSNKTWVWLEKYSVERALFLPFYPVSQPIALKDDRNEADVDEHRLQRQCEHSEKLPGYSGMARDEAVIYAGRAVALRPYRADF